MTMTLLQGNNYLHICPATMQAVMQAWLDEELGSPVEVTGVEHDGANNAYKVRFKRKQEEGTPT